MKKIIEKISVVKNKAKKYKDIKNKKDARNIPTISKRNNNKSLKLKLVYVFMIILFIISSFTIYKLSRQIFTKNKTGNKIESLIEKHIYDVVVVLTVWKRHNLERQLIQVKSQSIIKNKRINIIVFQNSNHVNAEEVVNKYKKPGVFPNNVDITFIQSPIETGYFGRFLAPLTSSVVGDSYFIICDDDMIWGSKYFENMIRVVNEGSLATRNGRILNKDAYEGSVAFKNGYNRKQICFDEDIEHDFGGHLWAGRISWLRKAWNHIPYTIENCEDFWISAALKTFYNIPTKTPKCPCPDGSPINPEMCAASDESALPHFSGTLGSSKISGSLRPVIMKEIMEKFKYELLRDSKPEYVKSIYSKYRFGDNLFDLRDPIWKNVLFWQ